MSTLEKLPREVRLKVFRLRFNEDIEHVTNNRPPKERESLAEWVGNTQCIESSVDCAVGLCRLSMTIVDEIVYVLLDAFRDARRKISQRYPELPPLERVNEDPSILSGYANLRDTLDRSEAERANFENKMAKALREEILLKRFGNHAALLWDWLDCIKTIETLADSMLMDTKLTASIKRNTGDEMKLLEQMALLLKIDDPTEGDLSKENEEIQQLKCGE